MCEPTTAAIALTVAKEGASLIGQAQQGAAEIAQQRQQVASNNAVANTQFAQLRIRQDQEREAAAREAFRASRESARNAATARVALGESGVSGNSVGALLRDFQTQEGLYKESLKRTLAMTESQLNAEALAIRTSTANENLSINKPVARPNYLGAALSVAGVGLDEWRIKKSKKA